MLSPLEEVCHTVIDHNISETGMFIINLHLGISESAHQKLVIFPSPYNTEISEAKLSLTLWTLAGF